MASKMDYLKFSLRTRITAPWSIFGFNVHNSLIITIGIILWIGQLNVPIWFSFVFGFIRCILI